MFFFFLNPSTFSSSQLCGFINDRRKTHIKKASDGCSMWGSILCLTAMHKYYNLGGASNSAPISWCWHIPNVLSVLIKSWLMLDFFIRTFAKVLSLYKFWIAKLIPFGTNHLHGYKLCPFLQVQFRTRSPFLSCHTSASLKNTLPISHIWSKLFFPSFFKSFTLPPVHQHSLHSDLSMKRSIVFSAF